MKRATFTALSIFLLISFSALAEDEKKDISEKEKQALIDIFGGKVEKQESPKKEEPKQDKRQEDKHREGFKELMKKREAELKKRDDNNNDEEERKKFKKDIERREEIREKMKNMTPEQKQAFIKELMKERAKRKRD